MTSPIATDEFAPAAPAADRFQEHLASIDPATGETVGTVERTPIAEVNAAIARARAAAPAWAALAPAERAERMRPLGAALVEHAERLGDLASREMGKPRKEAIAETRGCGKSLGETLDEIVAALEPEVRDDGATVSTVRFDPLGVAAVITPWNFPVAMPHWLLIPALAAGNAVVFKPSEETPLVAQAYADLLAPLLPEGVLQTIHGDDLQGRTLVSGDVDLVAFTGSREAGKSILAAASERLSRVILELGGKDPLVVLDGADLDAAARFAARNAFRNAGQVCVSTERIYVERSIAESFTNRLVELAGEHVVGPGSDEATTIGPMVHARQKQHVLRQVDDAVRRGARRRTPEREAEGTFVHPIVLDRVDHEMAIMREETFGPVACVMEVADADEAVRCANDSPFGLGAAVFGPEDRAAEVAGRLTAGMIGVNRSCGGASGTPWIGARESGYGFHGGTEGHRQFTQRRVISAARPKG